MSDLALAALAGFGIAEATGVTNFTGSGDGGSSTPPISIPQPQGPDMGDIAALLDAQQGDGPDMGAIAEAIASATDNGATVIETVGDSSSSGATAAFQSMVQQFQNQNRTLVERIQEQRQNVEDTVETTRDTAELIEQLRKWRDEIPTPDTDPSRDRDPNPESSGGSDDSSSGDDYDLRTDYDGIFSEEVRGAADILDRTGGVVNEARDAPTDAVNFAGKSGRTIGEAWDLITTGKADTSNTFAEDRGEVMFDYSGDGNPGGKLTDRLPDVDLSLGSDESDESDTSSASSTSSNTSTSTSTNTSASSASSRKQTDPIEEYKRSIRDEDDDPDHTAGRTRSNGGGGGGSMGKFMRS